MTKVAAPALLQKLAHPRIRPMLVSMYYGFYYYGNITAAFLCSEVPSSPFQVTTDHCPVVAGLYINSKWSLRFPSLSQTIGPFLVLSIIRTAPEPPRGSGSRAGCLVRELSLAWAQHLVRKGKAE